jgi:chitin disaccharide deacetylase
MLLSSELIGYPAGTRLLILNCDDFGMSEAVNAGVIAAVEQGVATSTSLMVPGPAAAAAMDLLRDRPHLPFGIHLTLVCDYDDRRWGPLTAAERVPSLLVAGAFVTPGRTAELLAQARIDEVELEFRAQIEAVLRAGLRPTHLDWHCLADGGRDDIFDLSLALADEYGLAIRAWLEAGSRKARRAGRPAVDHPFSDSFATDQSRYADLLRALPPGLSEWAVHPSTDHGETVRRTDLDFLVSAEAREIVRSEGIVLLDYRFAPPT